MFGIGSFNPVSLLATAALGPMGGVVAQLAQQMFAQVGQQIVQQLGQNMGMPQSVIDAAQFSFSGEFNGVQGGATNVNDAVASFGEATGASPIDIGRAQSDMQTAIDDVVRDLGQTEDVRDARNGNRAGGGWLRAMAEVLGKKLDSLAHEMEDLANKVTKDDPSTTTDFSVVSQQFNMLMGAATNAIKTIGEAMGRAAAKQ